MHPKAIYLKSLKLPMNLISHISRQPSENFEDSLLYWRMQIFSTIFLITIFIGAFPYASNMSIALKSGQSLNAKIYTFFYLLAIFLVLAKAIPFRVRVWVGLFLFYGVGITSTITLGLSGSGRIYFFAFSVLATLLLGFRAGVIALAMNVSTLFFFGCFVNMGYFKQSIMTSFTAEQWIATGFSFSFLNTIITVTIGVLVTALESNIKLERSLSKDLKLSNIRLEKKNDDYRLAEESLKKSEERYKTLTNNIHVGIYRNTTGLRGRFIEANPAIVEMFGYHTRDEFLSVNVADLYQNPDDRNNYNKKMLKNGSVNKYEIKLMKKDGTPFVGSVSAVAVKDANGEVQYYDGIIEDITGKRELELQLQQAQKMEAIGTLAGGIAHDFNNILSAILGYTELSLSEIENDSTLYQNLHEIWRAGGRAKDLVKQILTFSRQAEQELKPVKVKLIGKEAINFLRASLPTTIEIQKEIESDSLVMADPTQIHQLFMNLCTNAGHAMGKKGGELKVKLIDVTVDENLTAEHPELKPGPYLELTISDTGHGIPAHILDRIFDPFFTTKEKGEGTGMGLSVAHGIVGAYGGKIMVTSEPGKGSSFKIYLPKVERGEAHLPMAGKSIPTGTERILFVDDETALVNIGKQMLESLGYKVTCRTSSVEALELFKAKPDSFDIVITDMTMPNMTGDVLARELIVIKPGIPVVLCTGYSTQINQKQASAVGVRALVSKPVLKMDIADTIRKVLDQE